MLLEEEADSSSAPLTFYADDYQLDSLIPFESLVAQVLPEAELAKLKSIVPLSRGAGGHSAAVGQELGKKNAWTFSYNPSDYYNTTQTDYRFLAGSLFVIMHEWGHVESLDGGHIRYAEPGAELAAGEVQYGSYVATRDSYLSAFMQQFWSFHMRNNAYVAELTGCVDGYSEANYRYNKGSFYRVYAAGSPIEDFADSFALFVLFEDSSYEDEGVGVVLKAKYEFFKSYPEFVKLREEIRAKLIALFGSPLPA